mgnify:CR=1 FL=1
MSTKKTTTPSAAPPAEGAAEQSRLFDDDSIQGAPYYEAHRAATAVVDKAIESLDAALRSEESSRGR